MRSRISLVGFSSLFSLFFLLTAGLDHAVAATLNVAVGGLDADDCGAKAAPCRSLSRAIANAVPGDKILVGPGRYGDLDADGIVGEPGEETGAGGLVTIDKPLVVESVEGAATTLIDAAGARLAAVAIDASGVRFGKAKKGFTVANSASTGVFIAPAAANVTVSGIRAVRNESGFGSKASGLVFRDDVAEANAESGFELGGSGATIIACRATGNGTDGFAIDGNGHVLKGDVASANGESGFTLGGGALTFTGSIAAGNDIGLRVASSALTATGNSFFGNVGDGVQVSAPGVTLTKSNIFGNGSAGGANCGVRTVGGGDVILDKICFGAPTGPGDDPADQVCGTITVLEIIEKVLKIAPKVPL